MSKRLLILPMLLGTAAVTAYAENEAFANYNDSIRWHLNLHERTIVGESPRSLVQLPTQSTTLTSANIERESVSSMPALLENLGITSMQRSQGGGGSPTIRGFEASRVLLMVDDIRMNNLIYRCGHLQNLLTIDPFMLGSVEVINGPSSVLYGSDALGGVIHMHTRAPKLGVMTGSVMAHYGTASEEAKVGTWFNLGFKKFASMTSISATHFGNMRAGRNKNPFLPDDDAYITRKYLVSREDGKDVYTENPKPWLQQGSGYKQIDLMQKFLFAPTDVQTHTLNFQFSTTTDINRYDRLTDITSKGKPKFAEWYYGPQKRYLLGYTLKLNELTWADRALFNLSYQRVEESRNNRKLNDNWLGHRIEKVDVVNLSFDFIKRIGRHAIEGGLDGSLNWLNTSAYKEDIATGELGALDTRYPLGDNRMHNIDIFLQHRYRGTGDWSFSEGARIGYSYLYSEFAEQNFYPFLNGLETTQNNFTYSLYADAQWRPSQQFSITGAIQTGYRVPNIDDMGKVFDSSSSDGKVIVPNPDLKPEKTLGVELHADWKIGDAVRVTPSVYYTYLFDAIALARATSVDSIVYEGVKCPAYANFNARRAYIVGASLNVDANLCKDLTLNARYTYTYGRILNYPVDDVMTEGETCVAPLDHIAPAYGRIGLRYTPKAWDFEVWSLWNARKKLKDYATEGEDNITYATVKGLEGDGMPAWFTLNARVGYDLKYATVRVGVDNILDTLYRTFGSGINATGRNFYVSLTYNW